MSTLPPLLPDDPLASASTPAISGYRNLSAQEISLINYIKRVGGELQALIDTVVKEGNPDPRWVAEARTDLQKGLMSLTRAVAKPTSF